ncbi:hypothetical protein JOD54_001887 [Actinokineospora baliensis]|uniref:DUF6445 family protein n=1 Tax=Actinokineospora baliensis TaxID=547056 RepID=UPI00195BAE1F|nr:DUF6445 family protein [Actinokineospora baliensis]MBM7771683.1 hypothetical protein [Actinokineospora baliensis]
MRSRVIVVDDFYPKPEVIRRRALESEYADITASRYPGYQTRVNVESDAIKRTFEALIGAHVQVDRSRFTWGGFRFITSESGRRSRVHADINIDWAGMVYLTENAGSAGTGFFRHRETGVERPPTDREARALGFADAHEFQQRVVARDDADFAKWELTTSIAPVYNRLILFRGCEFYHAPLGGSGDDFATSRLTHSFFFNERAKVGQPAYALADR